jgi:hypothetical protein
MICRLLHDLLKNDSFQWFAIHSKSFCTLKDCMTKAPMLALPNFSLPFTLETDASGAGIGLF